MKVQANNSMVFTFITERLSTYTTFLVDSSKQSALNNIFSSVYEGLMYKYGALECTFIGDWDDESSGASSISTLFLSKFQEFLPSIDTLLGDDFNKSTIAVLTRMDGGTDGLEVNAMTELSPITATLGSIITPDGKSTRGETKTYGKTETVTDPDMQIKAVELYTKYKSIVTMIDFCYRSLLDEYTKLY